MPVINPIEPVAPGQQQFEEGPCTWPLDTTCVEGWASVPPNTQVAATAWAVQILWALSGRQYGSCPVTIRPCGPSCGVFSGYMTFPVLAGGGLGAGTPWMIPWIDNGVWRNCGCTGGCSCRARCEVPLLGPVAAIDEVKIDGVVIAPTAYRVDVYRGIPILVRTDGQCWPECQDMDADVDDVGSFTITYQRGVAVPKSGQIAAGKLAGEFAKACAGQDCALPQQLASLTRNGVQVEVVDPSTFLDNGLTGIADVDLWIRAVNPARKAQRSRVYSSDSRGVRVVV